MALEERLVTRAEELIDKAGAVLATRRPPPRNVLTSDYIDSSMFSEWMAQSLSFLTNLLGSEHVYVESFRKNVTNARRPSPDNVLAGQGILRAVKEDLEGGYLTEVRTLVSAEVFTDFLEMARHLHENGYKDPAASLAGAVLEDGLRRIAVAKGLTVRDREDLGSLNQKIANVNAYNRLVQKKIKVWTDVRNSADHGKFDEYSSEDVLDMIRGVETFLANQL